MRLLWRTFVRGCHKVAGLDSPYSSTDYGINWTKQRRQCLERDEYACRVCGDEQNEIGQAPSVHHITPRSSFEGTPREMNALDNLVSLCPSCHGQLEGKYTDCSVAEFVDRAQQNL